MAKAAPAPAAEAPPPKRSKKLLIIVIAAVLVVLVLAGAVVTLLLLKKGGNPGDADEAAEGAPAASAAVDLSKPPTFVALEPFVVNLAPAEGERYLQVVLALRVADARTADELKGFMPDIRHQINLVLSSKLPSELSTPEGRESLANELRERANGVLGGGTPRAKRSSGAAPSGPIQAVLFNSFIIQ